MAEKLKALCKDGLEFLLRKIKEDYVTKEEFNYKPITINSFSNNKNTQEMGATITDILLSWALSKKPKTLTLDEQPLTVTDTSKSLSGQAIKSNKTWTLKAVDEKGATATKTTSIAFLNGVYWGAKTAPDNYDSAFILGLSKALQANKTKTFTATAGSGEYLYYCIPSRYGEVLFNVGGFDGGFTKVSTIEFTNASGYKENYDIYKSDNENLGKQTVVCK